MLTSLENEPVQDVILKPRLPKRAMIASTAITKQVMKQQFKKQLTHLQDVIIK
jgi:hypothetical protein